MEGMMEKGTVLRAIDHIDAPIYPTNVTLQLLSLFSLSFYECSKACHHIIQAQRNANAGININHYHRDQA